MDAIVEYVVEIQGEIYCKELYFSYYFSYILREIL
jgi:hypothetical protein